MNEPFSIAILAGGQSRRMGRNKALIEVGGRPVLQRVIDSSAPLSDDRFLVTNSPETYHPFGLPMVPDRIPGRAALGGLYTALHQARHPWTLVLACDMPLLEPALITFLAGLRRDVEVVVPRLKAYPEPLHAFYHKDCLHPIETQLKRERLKLIGFFPAVRVCYVDEDRLTQASPNLDSLVNLNTPADVAAVEKKLAGGDNST